MDRYLTFNEALEKVSKMSLEELSKEPIDPILEDILKTFKNMSEIVQQYESKEINKEV